MRRLRAWLVVAMAAAVGACSEGSIGDDGAAVAVAVADSDPGGAGGAGGSDAGGDRTKPGCDETSRPDCPERDWLCEQGRWTCGGCLPGLHIDCAVPCNGRSVMYAQGHCEDGNLTCPPPPPDLCPADDGGAGGAGGGG